MEILTSSTARAGQSSQSDNRLNSWKEIAAYLGRDIRTVQRWEQTQGLPVHRHRHSRLSTAYALRSELDAWWHNHPTAGASGTADRTGATQTKASDSMDRAIPPHEVPLPRTADSEVALGARSSARRNAVRQPGTLATFTVVIAGVVALTGHYYMTGDGSRNSPVAADQTLNAAGVESGSNRVTVAVFDNRTGDPALDRWGWLAADRIIQGLATVTAAEVDPAAISNSVHDAFDTGPARTLVTGSFYVRGALLEFHAQIVELPGNRLLHAIKPVGGAQADVDAVLHDLQDRVAGAIAVRYDRRFDLALTSAAPRYAAYREFVVAVEHFGKDYPTAYRHLERALALEPMFVVAGLQASAGYRNEGRYEDAAAALAPFLERRHLLSEFERLLVDWSHARLRGHLSESLALLTEALVRSPRNDMLHYAIGLTLVQLNRPRAALETFAKWGGPDTMTRTGVAAWRFDVAATARHMLGEYEAELEESNAAIRADPQSSRRRAGRARALIGLGQTEEAVKVFDEVLTLPGVTGPMLLNLALELRAHGRGDRARAIISRILDWYRARPRATATTQTMRAGLAGALYVAAQWDEAERAYTALTRDFPHEIDYIGALGALAARRGDRAAATRRSEELARLERPYIFGRPSYLRARIAALLGDAPTAVDLLRESFAQGQAFVIDIHCDVDFESLRHVSAFSELTKPT